MSQDTVSPGPVEDSEFPEQVEVPSSWKDDFYAFYEAMKQLAVVVFVVTLLMGVTLISVFFAISLITCIPFETWVEFFQTGIEPAEPPFSFGLVLWIFIVNIQYMTVQWILYPFYITLSIFIYRLVQAEKSIEKNKKE